ncbi:MAG TPA: hypothetical protein VKR58_04830, partial [Aquella sp.]|nr:hypothetical protein [Aquella sp.]
MESLETLIKRKISIRIFISILLIFCLFVVLSVYEVRKNIIILGSNINNDCRNMEEYVISQALVPNQAAITKRITEFNNQHPYQIKWVNINVLPKDKFTVHFTNWVYYYSLRPIGNIRFGYFVVSGSLQKQKELYLTILPYLIFIAGFCLLLLLLLVPLAKSIPGKLFVEPLNTILNSLLQVEKVTKNDRSYINSKEIMEITTKVEQLLQQVKEQSKNAAVGLLAREIAHDIQSPLSTLQYCKDKLSSIKEVDKNLLKSLKTSIDSIKYILINLLNLNIKQPKKEYEKSDTAYTLFHDLIDSVIVQKSIEYR